MVPKLSRVMTQDERTPPAKSRDTSILQSYDNSKTSYFLNHRVHAPQTQQGTAYSVVITIEVCAERNWLIQVSAYFYPLSKKLYMKCERSCQDATGSLCSPKINTKTTTRTKNDEMNQSVTNSKIHLYHCLCVSKGFIIARSSHQRCSIKKVLLKISQN